MADVLEVYTRPYDPRLPQVCLDETTKQLVGETRLPLPVRPGQPARFDYEYERHGVASLFLACEPLRGWRHVWVGDHRAANDWAHVIKDLVDVYYPDAEKIVQVAVVADTLKKNKPASLYATFPPAEAKRLADKLELHDTPKHGSWLDIAEIELSVLARQCLDRRLDDPTVVRAEVAAWAARRNARGAPVAWRFTTADARIKLQHLYPSLDP